MQQKLLYMLSVELHSASAFHRISIRRLVAETAVIFTALFLLHPVVLVCLFVVMRTVAVSRWSQFCKKGVDLLLSQSRISFLTFENRFLELESDFYFYHDETHKK